MNAAQLQEAPANGILQHPFVDACVSRGPRSTLTDTHDNSSRNGAVEGTLAYGPIKLSQLRRKQRPPFQQTVRHGIPFFLDQMLSLIQFFATRMNYPAALKEMSNGSQRFSNTCDIASTLSCYAQSRSSLVSGTGRYMFIFLKDSSGGSYLRFRCPPRLYKYVLLRRLSVGWPI